MTPTEERDAGRRLAGFAAGLLDPDIETPPDLFGPRAMPAGRRYSVYRNNVVVSLMEAMRTAYPSLLAIMGGEKFDLVARNFIYRHPPKSPLMQDYGNGFDAFLASFRPLAKSPFLADVARAERAWLVAYHAADALPLNGADIASVAGEAAMDLIFEPHPALAIVRSDYPVASLFQWRYAVPEGGVDLESPETLLITRPQIDVELHRISPAEATFLEALARRRRLGEASNAAFAVEAEFDLAGTLRLALSAGCLARPGSAIG